MVEAGLSLCTSDDVVPLFPLLHTRGCHLAAETRTHRRALQFRRFCPCCRGIPRRVRPARAQPWARSPPRTAARRSATWARGGRGLAASARTRHGENPGLRACPMQAVASLQRGPAVGPPGSRLRVAWAVRAIDDSRILPIPLKAFRLKGYRARPSLVETLGTLH